MFENYTLAYWGILVSLILLVMQGIIAAGSKASAPGAIPGKIDDSLSHSSFIFRANRTFMNSLENYPAFIGASFLAINIGSNPLWTGLMIWIFACARIAHMALYYLISTEKNPSPRSYFFLIGLTSNVVLLLLCAITLLNN